MQINNEEWGGALMIWPTSSIGASDGNYGSTNKIGCDNQCRP